jgi:hypothetical protein
VFLVVFCSGEVGPGPPRSAARGGAGGGYPDSDFGVVSVSGGSERSPASVAGTFFSVAFLPLIK